MKTLSIAVPCYNSQDYMEKSIDSLLVLGDDVEVILVDDGSTDNTGAIADKYATDFPDIVKVVHQENGGHGEAVNTGLNNASGLYFKVVDSDDWLDRNAMQPIMRYLSLQREEDNPTDLVMANYVYEKVYENKRQVMRYKGVIPIEQKVTWDEIGHFPPTKYILMHSVIYRTQMLKDMGLKLPSHCFYVDNIFVYEPLPYVKSICYFDLDMYHYFIGRSDQSVNEKTMMGRIDQQIRVTKIMIDAVNLDYVESSHLRKYMLNYLSMMMCICTVFLRMKETQEADVQLKELWQYLKAKDPVLYRRIRRKVINFWTNLPTEAGRKISLGGYHLSQKIFKFN